MRAWTGLLRHDSAHYITHPRRGAVFLFSHILVFFLAIDFIFQAFTLMLTTALVIINKSCGVQYGAVGPFLGFNCIHFLRAQWKQLYWQADARSAPYLKSRFSQTRGCGFWISRTHLEMGKLKNDAVISTNYILICIR